MDLEPEEQGGDPACWSHLFDEGAEPQPWPHDELVHLWWVDPGRLAGGEYPGDHTGVEASTAKIDLLVDAGFRTFVDLTTDQDPLWRYEPVVDEVAHRRGLDLRWIRFPIPDMSVGPDELYDEIVAAIDAALARGGVFVHCWGGIGRTGTVIGCWLVDRGMTSDDAIAHIASARAGTRKAGRHSPETRSQRELIHRRWDRRS